MLSFIVQKAAKTKVNELMKKNHMCKSLGRNSNDIVMAIRFLVCLAAVE